MNSLLNYAGHSFEANYSWGWNITGKIQVEDWKVYLCQNTVCGYNCTDKLGYSSSYYIGHGTEKDLVHFGITNFKLIKQ